MIAFLEKNFDILISFLCGIILIIGSYNLLLNVHQASTLKKTITVRDNDTSYNEYQENILLIENRLEEIEDLSIKTKFRYVVELMKNGGAYQLFPYSNVSALDLYDLNNYFIDTLINEGWIACLRMISEENSKIYNDYVSMMVYQYNYISKELLDNGNYYQFSYDDKRDILQEEYDGILGNYCSYSRLVVELLKDFGDDHEENN